MDTTGRHRRSIAARAFGAVALAAALSVMAFGLGSCSSAEEGEGPEGAADYAGAWTCSMHPQVRQPGPGDCPICGMDLIPVHDEELDVEAGDRSLVVSEAGLRLMEIETSPVERRHVAVDVSLVGKVAYDEGRVSRIAAWVPGRVEQLHVDYVGFVVERGDPLLDLYGPDLLAAQEELIQSRRAYDAALEGGSERAIDAARNVLEASRERLGLWGLSADQVAEIEESDSGEPVLTIPAPTGGTVTEKSVEEGMYVRMGQQLLTIADLSHVWIELSAYESDLPWLSKGQTIEFEVAAIPGETFSGTLSFIEPVVDPMTRTVTARAEVANERGLLKPDMFVRATVHASTAGEGGTPPVVIPSTAPLLTGRRAVVYVRLMDADRPTFEGREVVLGPRAGSYYVVVSGLEPGELVVTEGAFKIDSALQIRAQPSMMSPEADGTVGSGGGAAHRHAPEARGR